MTITKTKSETKGALTAHDDQGDKMGEMTYSITGADMIIIDHTDVEDAYRGQGVGKALWNEMVKMARSEHIKIMPLCPYAKSMFDKHPEASDVLR